MEPAKTPLVPPEKKSESKFNNDYGATAHSSHQGQGQSLRSSLVNNPESQKIARSVVSRVGQFLLTKCGKKNQPGPSAEDEEYNLADEVRKPNESTRNMLTKFDKQIKAKVTEMGMPTPVKLIFIGYKTHQISGIDYFLKVKASNSGQYFHVRIYETLQSDLILQDVAGPKFTSDKIEIPT